MNTVQNNCQLSIINCQLSRAHARFRQFRNGEIVDNLTAHGITYRIAWGLESYHLKEIAAEFEASAELADALWAEDVRESKMLATRLYPAEEFPKEKALAWIKEAKYAEITDQLTMNLLSKTSFATELLDLPIDDYCALKLATRIEYQSERLLAIADNLLTNDAPLYLKTAALWYKELFNQENQDNVQ